MRKLVLVRHGQSVWNLENRFTGWTDVDLTAEGVREARAGAGLLIADGYAFDVAYTSVLKRAIRTLWLILDDMDLMWVPVIRDWRLNERHYGALAGLNKAETAERHGKQQVFIWRRSYDTQPPALDRDDPRHPAHDPRYACLPASQVPATESLKDVVMRIVPYWESTIAPSIRSGKRVLIVAHGNSLRALIKHLDQVPEDEIAHLNIPTGIPLTYELDDTLRPIRHYYLGDPVEAARAAAAVAAQLEQS